VSFALKGLRICDVQLSPAGSCVVEEPDGEFIEDGGVERRDDLGVRGCRSFGTGVR
jgi:hypothetical protein